MDIVVDELTAKQEPYVMNLSADESDSDKDKDARPLLDV